MFYFDSLDTSFRNPMGPVAQGSSIDFTLKADFCDGLWGAELFIIDDNTGKRTFFPMEKSTDGVTDLFKFTYTPQKVGLFWYYFVAKQNGFDTVIGRDDMGHAVPMSDSLRSWQLTVYEKNFRTPDWIKGGLYYQIFVDRFNKGADHALKSTARIHENWYELPDWKPNEEGLILNNDFFGGDLKGVEKKLDYLRSLGVTCIYLNPIFDAYSNHKYDTGDYSKIDSMFGDEKDFKSLCKSAKRRGISVICDGVFNHVGADSVYFNKYHRYDGVGAYESPDSPYYNWFRFYEYPDKYECWWNFDTLPDINEDNPDFCEFINGKNGIISKWIKNGARGWRLDVADELPDSFLEALRKAAKGASKDALIIGEVWEDASNKISYDKRRKYFQGKQLDAVMNYPLKNAIIDYVRYGNSHGLAVTMRELCDNYPKDTLNCLMNILGTHDTPRIITALAGRIIEGNDRERKAGTRLSDSEWRLGIHRLKIASLLQYTLPGVPCVYYGDEAGMEGYNDPFNRQTYPWGKENADLISWYTFLGSVRKASHLFKDGNYKNICHENGVFAFSRENGNETLIVCVNLSDKDYNLHLDSIYYDLSKEEAYKGDLTVEPQSYYILKKV